MRTTLILDHGVATLLKRVVARQCRSRTAVVNDALRDGLARQVARQPHAARFETRAVDLGRCLVPGLDSIAQLLALAEGESYK